MQKQNYLTLPIVLTFLFSVYSCKQEKQSDEITYKYYNLQQQGWKSKKITQYFNDISYSATEVPIQYYFLKNTDDLTTNIDSLYQVNSQERIIEVEFQQLEEKDLLMEDFTQMPYEEAVKYLAFQIEKDFTVVTSSNDTIQCLGVNFERNFNVAPFKRVLLYFNNIKPNDNIKLIYRDHLFGNGIVKFNFNETPIKL